MPWPYNAGDTTPADLPGIVEVTGLRLGGPGGTFSLLSVPPFWQTPPLRITAHPAPNADGGLVTNPKFDIWQFDLTGEFNAEAWQNVQAATDYLHAHVNRDLGWQTWSFLAYGWTAAKTLTCRLAGQVTVSGGDAKGEMMSPARSWTIPLVAANPVLA